MKVQEVQVAGNIRYILIDSNGGPVVTVAKYLKYLDLIGKSTNTLKAYCYHLKLYYQFLEEIDLDYKEVDLSVLANFIGWLRNPHQSTNVINIREVKARRSESTVNVILTCIMGFYDYLSRLDYYNNELSKKTKAELPSRFRNFKPFLHHITKGKHISKNILKLKEPKRQVKVLTKLQVNKIYEACTNIRDQLLIRILYEGGIRIGEALSLWIEDLDIGKNAIIVRKSKTINGEFRKVYISSETINMFQDYLIDFHSEDIDSNFLFIALTGENKGQPLSKEAVYSLVRRLKKKTGIDFTLHMFRHTFATEMYENGMDVGSLQRLLGHAQVQTTIQTYMHPSDDTLRKNYDKATSRKENKDG
ncbi:tyrosine-type recombinase/integrase [Pseudogracilibacillus sp. SE30717A]|uniref:tyrosine-type recombinase/integrase n=1 Tax=Pseudogracilibacillus sp. SE30717A TaxID=3098293 RepID=UPI00300DDE24